VEKMENIPIYKAKKINSDEHIQGFLFYSKNGYAIQYVNEIKNDGISISPIKDSIIDVSTLEISDGLKFRKLSECNFRTDYEMDMHNYNGYSNGWNNALSQDGTHPCKVAEQIMNNK
jgi:hypothetical protein